MSFLWAYPSSGHQGDDDQRERETGQDEREPSGSLRTHRSSVCASMMASISGQSFGLHTSPPRTSSQ